MYITFMQMIYILILFIELVSTLNSSEVSLSAPKFIIQYSSSIASEGRTKILQCQAIGYPIPQYQWLKNGQALTDFTSDSFYRIIRIQRSDAGSYQCIAKNDIGAIFSEKIDISVAYMGTFENETERTITVRTGEAVVIDLPFIESYPTPSVIWQTNDDSPLLYRNKYFTTLKQQLVILSIDKTDEKLYRACATNTQFNKEEYSPYIRLKVTESNENTENVPKIIIKPNDLKVVKGQIAEFECVSNVKALHEVETLWFKDDILIDEAEISYIFRDAWNRTLSLSVNVSYTGNYSCHVRLKTENYPPITASAQLFVHEKPQFTRNIPTETWTEYDASVRLYCDTVGLPKPKITWFRNAQNITDLLGIRYFLENDNTLLIKKVSVDDAGMFQCLAYNEAGESSMATWLRIKTSVPIFEKSPKNVTILDDKNVTINCRVLGAPKPNVTWIFNDSQSITLSNRTKILDSGDLLIAPVLVSDSGKYTCIRANEAGVIEAHAYVKILVQTKIIQAPVDTKVLLGETALLHCTISNDATVPFQLDWYHNKQLIQSGVNQRINILSDGSLKVKAVRAADVGQYICSVKSPGGNDTKNAFLSVIELPFAPSNLKAFRVENITQRAINLTWTPGFDGNSPIRYFVIQKCEVPDLELYVDAVPDSLLNWVTELNNVSAKHKWVLLTNLKASTAYQFRISAVNSVGEGSSSEPSNIVVLPQEVPSGPPQNFVGSARSSSEIIIQWHPPLDEHRNGIVLGYIVRYRLFGYKIAWNYLNITNEAQRNYLIQDLITWKDYVIQVAAYNNKGVGVFSQGITIKTKEGIPESAPEILNVTAINSTAIELWWLPPNPQKINGINQGYKIQAWINDTESKMMTVAPNLLHPLAEQFTTMTGLKKFTSYNITILCFTDPGDGELSERVPIKTCEDVPDEVPSLQFDEISDRAVKVIWKSPLNINGILTKYQLKYQIKDRSDTLKILQLTPNTTSVKITNLRATTHYRFEITAWSFKGSSIPKAAIIQSGIEPVLPKPPTKLALSNIEAYSVVLQFTPGFDGNSSIIKWTVESQTTRNATWVKVFEIEDPDATTISVTGLIPFTNYRLRLIANNVVGASEPSKSSKEFQTIQAFPAHPPLNVTVRAISSTELKVRWIPLQQIEWHGNPRGYNISYTEVNSGITKNVMIDDHTANSFVIKNLEEFTIYTIFMKAINDVGTSISSPIVKDRTRESVPSLGPLDINANATSSTTIVVSWNDIPEEHRNGIIEGYKVYYGINPRLPFQFRQITNNKTYTITLTELRKFVTYYIQVLGYTRLGDGRPSKPPITIQTFEDVPGQPSNVSFPDVSLTSARIIWDIPLEPNGEILAYKVTYRLDDEDNYLKYTDVASHEFTPSDRTFRALNLEEERYYLFTVTARTRLGWGKTIQCLVFTTNNRQLPQAPSELKINENQIQSDQITITWVPGRDGFAPLRYYTIQFAENNGVWTSIEKRVEPHLISYTISKLKPFRFYKFRIQATNDLGPSTFSNESITIRTLSAAPNQPVINLKVVPITTNSVQVIWKPIDLAFWNGDSDSGRYRIFYQPISDFSTEIHELLYEEALNFKANEIILKNLQEDRNYEIVVQAFNARGDGPKSSPVTVYVGEAVPTGFPKNFDGEAVSSTEVRLRWKPMETDMQNGELLGYKIFYLVTFSPQEMDENNTKLEEEIEVVPATYTSYSLIYLDQYTEYRIQILAFNPAGDGPRSNPITVQTFQSLPESPKSIQFEDITMNSLRVIWEPPKKRNGNIVGYLVTYETCEQNDKFSKQVKQKVTGTSLFIQSLEENVAYTFTVRAQTIDYGPMIAANVTTGPQDGSPISPKKFTLIRTDSSIELNWINGPSGKGPILGYYIEGKRKDDSRWQVITKTTHGSLEEFSISYQSLLPSTNYQFRLISYNKYGVSNPITAEDLVLTPSKLYLEYRYLQQKPFYRQTWFMVVLAASSTVIIIAIIAVLCVKSQSYKYKEEARLKLEESLSTLDLDDRHDFNMGLYRARHQKSFNNGCVTISKRGTLNKKLLHHHSSAMLAKSPPRPSPALVTYHSDDESTKEYDENPDDSSGTDKPSEISSSETQGSDESENDSIQSHPHSFANHYANVNDSLRQTWKRQKPVRDNSTIHDSNSDIPDGLVASSPKEKSSSILNLSGPNAHLMLNNMARSRAPLPGFSSFV